MIYCVYEHWLDKKCIYVGSGKISRAFNFWRNEEYNNFVLNRKDDINVKIVALVETKEESLDIEKEVTIQRMKQFKLFNIFIANSMNDETKNQISKKLKGTHLSEERKNKISKTLTGKKLSPERIESIREKTLERYRIYICANINGKIYEFENKKFFFEEISKKYSLSERSLGRSVSNVEKYPKSFKKKNIIIITDDFLKTYI